MTQTIVPALHRLYDAAVAADNRWSAALERQYGSQAGDARYDARGTATPELAALSNAVRDANETRYVAWLASRKAVQP